uniref:Linoleate 9S-lipoxygenase n=3 Tax=Zeugodacus cucurbitae TaxID=28588 RepID=A0A0A1XIK0_ZEUCU
MFANRVWSALSLACLIGIVISSCGLAEAKVAHKIHCTEDQMQVEIQIPETNKEPQIYLEGLKDYPNERCQPQITDSQAVFRLSLTDFYECGVTRMVNQLTGKKVYYHKILIESDVGKEVVSVKCITTEPFYNVLMLNATKHHGVVRRDVLPAGFQEPEDLEITTSLTERAPEPRLSIGVNQNGKKVTGDLTVTPGTPLTMEINLDRDSASVYGLGVNYLEVTDTRQLSETIVFKGCTVDPYLFENFNTIDGDTLSAKFKAFKFPDSSYVQFRATVNVCLDKCLGTQCSNGQIGYGRRRRDTTELLAQGLMDTNKVYEISLAMFIKINDIEGVNRNEVLQLEEKLRELKLANQRLARNSRVNFGESLKTFEQPIMSVPAFVVDERELSQAQTSASNAASSRSLALATLFFGFCAAVCRFM